MMCSNCRSEIGSQPVCPYCGKIQVNTRSSEEDFGQQRTVPVAQQPYYAAMNSNQVNQNAMRGMNRQLSGVELRSKLSLVLSVGIFLLQIIMLIVMISK